MDRYRLNIRNQWEEGLVHWREHLQRDEWYFARLRETITSRLSQPEAFSALDEAAELVLSQSDEFLASEATQLLVDLVRIAETTELPEVLEARWDSLIAHISRFGEYQKRQAKELRRYFRR